MKHDLELVRKRLAHEAGKLYDAYVMAHGGYLKHALWEQLTVEAQAKWMNTWVSYEGK